MKLYNVEIIRELEDAINILVVADKPEDALKKAYKDYDLDEDDVYKYFINEIDMIDGYKILLEKVDNNGLR